ncbi:protein of unknown function (plasmid) [Caballeronia sp. S22]
MEYAIKVRDAMTRLPQVEWFGATGAASLRR